MRKRWRMSETKITCLSLLHPPLLQLLLPLSTPLPIPLPFLLLATVASYSSSSAAAAAAAAAASPVAAAEQSVEWVSSKEFKCIKRMIQVEVIHHSLGASETRARLFS